MNQTFTSSKKTGESNVLRFFVCEKQRYPSFPRVQDQSLTSLYQYQDRLRFFSQQCDSSINKREWTINNNLQCSDNNVTTKDDRCLNGVCKGKSYSCLECEQHNGSGCPIKSGYCIIQNGSQRECYAKEEKKLDYPCQVGFLVRLQN